jgi:hypothetical protein
MSEKSTSESDHEYKLTFVSPLGTETVNPNPDVITRLIETAGPDYWEAGSGDAAIRRTNGCSRVVELIMVIRTDVGCFLQFVEGSTSEEFVLTSLDTGEGVCVIKQVHPGNACVGGC